MAGANIGKKRTTVPTEKISIVLSEDLTAKIRQRGAELSKEFGRNVYMGEVVEGLLRQDFGLESIDRSVNKSK